jgi:glutamyl-tRNA synthetase
MEIFENLSAGSRLVPDELDSRSHSVRGPELFGKADGRFAPSPTGPLHVGNLRTALLAWLFARSVGARFLVRVEDLDRSRVRPGVEEAQLTDLRAIGLDWDGPIVRQSERITLYEEAIARLDSDGHLYPCYCTRAEIRASASAPHGIPADDRYPGTCRELTAAERAEREAAGRPPALRVRAEGARVAFEDRLLGRREEKVDDFVVRRNDGAPAYQLAVTVDDAAQEIGEVVRGADLVDSTPRQLLLAHLLGLPAVPRYAHVPLVLGPDGRRLAKRHGAVTLAERSVLGEGPEEILDWMARSLGLAEPGEAPTPTDLLASFAPDRLPLEPTVWSPEQARTTPPKTHNRARTGR